MKKQLIILFSLLFSISLISAALTITSPANSAILTDTVVLNVTGGGFNMTNCSFYAKSASTANSSWTLLVLDAKNMSGVDFVNATFNSTILEDSNDYIFNATCRNLTDTNNYATITKSGISINNTAPSIPVLTTANNTIFTSLITITSTVGNPNTTSCYYLMAEGAITGTLSINGMGTYSGDSCSFTFSAPGATYNGNWFYYIMASDGLDNSSKANGNFTLSIPYGTGGGPTVTTQQPIVEDNTPQPIVKENIGQKIKNFIISFKNNTVNTFKNLGQALKNFKNSILNKFHK